MAGAAPQITGVNGLTFGALGFISNLNSMTFGGLNSSINALNGLTISNANSAVPLRISNSGDNPTVIIEATTGSDIIPVELALNNGLIISAIGNARSNPRGNFWYCNGADALQISNINRRMVANYSPSSPCFATSGVNGQWNPGVTGVNFTSGVPYLIGTQVVTLSTNNFPIPTNSGVTQAYFGLQGNASYILNNQHELTTTVFIQRQRGVSVTGPFLLYGSAYNLEATSTGKMTQLLNGISFNEATPANSLLFQIGDIVTLTVFATHVGGGCQMTTAPVGLSAVMSPVFY
jgi:hypothetical protein